jgi:phosphotransferase system  glucose/maltose/N-acetylglucosamine-specific IIC component
MALTIGILFGIYSSVFVAAAIAMWLGIRREDLIKAAPKKTKTQTTPTRARLFKAVLSMALDGWRVEGLLSF